MTISESFKRFQYFNFETNFLENENLFQKTGAPFFSWNHKIENTSFPFKTALSDMNKTNRMVTIKWTYHKEWRFASNYFIFLENLFHFYNLLKRVNLMYQRPKCPYLYFPWALEFTFGRFFPLSIRNKKPQNITVQFCSFIKVMKIKFYERFFFIFNHSILFTKYLLLLG